MYFIDEYANTKYDGLAVRSWLIENVDIAVTVAGLYLASVFVGPDLLERYVFSRGKSSSSSSAAAAAAAVTAERAALSNGKRTAEKEERAKPFLLRWSWALWNLLLAVFSFYGASNVVPVVVRKVRADGFEHTLCTFDEKEFYTGPFGMALGLYCLSKGPELIDTAFLLLSGKKRLPFLQWFHHVTTFLYSWHAYAVGSSALQFASSLNYSVHAVMYFYFFLAEAGLKNVVKPFGIYITMLQIAQMVVGTALTLMLMSYKLKDYQQGRPSGSLGSCSGSTWSIARVQTFIAVINLILFTDMFLKAYVFKKKKTSTSASRNGTAAVTKKVS